jgi:predicted RNase H-like nuclease (RuvC/YqgF family)
VELEGKSSELEQRCHELSQKLRVSELAVQELEGASGQCSLLEEKLEETNTQLKLTQRDGQQLEEVRNIE